MVQTAISLVVGSTSCPQLISSVVTVNNSSLSVFPFWFDTCSYDSVKCCVVESGKLSDYYPKHQNLCFYLWSQTAVSVLVSVPIIPEPEVKSEGKDQIE